MVISFDSSAVAAILLISWIVCAIVASWIATTRKAPDPGAWAALGLAYGPIGVIGALVFAKPAAV